MKIHKTIFISFLILLFAASALVLGQEKITPEKKSGELKKKALRETLEQSWTIPSFEVKPECYRIKKDFKFDVTVEYKTNSKNPENLFTKWMAILPNGQSQQTSLLTVSKLTENWLNNTTRTVDWMGPDKAIITKFSPGHFKVKIINVGFGKLLEKFIMLKAEAYVRRGGVDLIKVTEETYKYEKCK